MYVVIMAGGKGTRLWPMSRELQPKQFQQLVSDQTLLQETYARIRPVAEPHEVFISTTSDLVDLCREQLPELPPDNVLVEPVGRNTGPAIGYVAAYFAQRDPGAIVATVASDHAIGKPGQFVAALRLAHQTIEQQPDKLMTIGLRPTWGDPGFGYIKADLPPGMADPELQVVPVARFEEKPSAEVAQQYYESGNYYWNASYFLFRADTMLAAIERYSPEIHTGLATIAQAMGGADYAQVLDTTYRALPSVPIDTLVFEPESQAGRVLVIPASLEWDDLGNWKTLRDKMCEWTGQDVVCRGDVIPVGTSRSLIYALGNRLVATVGLQDVVVIDTPDALLICSAERAQDVKEVLAGLAAGDPRR